VIAIAAQNAIEPDARMRADVNVSDYLRTGRNERGIGYPRTNTLVRCNRHNKTSLNGRLNDPAVD
jgi:hypothetical protein